MKVFSSPIQFAGHLVKLALIEQAALQAGLKEVTKLIKKTAKEEIGHYQPAVGNFPAWAELADSTKADRVRQGYTENDPLLRSGELRDSIDDTVKGLEGYVGSDSDKMIWQELGTPTIPARPMLGPAAFRNKEKIKKIVGIAAVSGILGSEKIKGYDFDTK